MVRKWDPNPRVHRRLIPDRYHPQRGADVWTLRRALRKRAKELGLRVSLSARGPANPHLIGVGQRIARLLGVDVAGGNLSERAQTVIRNPNTRTHVETERAKRAQPSPRERAVTAALHYASLRITEKPAGSNSGPHITDWQRSTARGATYLDRQPWCGVFVENLCRDVGVGTVAQWASVAAIEDLARQGRGGLARWLSGFHAQGVRPGDLVVLFGRGVHVEMVVAVHSWGYVTVGGNTSSGPGGSQSNGGGVFKRSRPASSVHGIAIANYPS